VLRYIRVIDQLGHFVTQRQQHAFNEIAESSAILRISYGHDQLSIRPTSGYTQRFLGAQRPSQLEQSFGEHSK